MTYSTCAGFEGVDTLLRKEMPTLAVTATSNFVKSRNYSSQLASGTAPEGATPDTIGVKVYDQLVLQG